MKRGCPKSQKTFGQIFSFVLICTKIKSMKRHNKVTFKEYNMYQLELPTDLEDLIPENHVVRLVNNIIEGMEIDLLISYYKGGGSSSYHPKMLLKVIVYAYTQKIYSSRKIAKALRENINFMWISGRNTPDFRTINRFRSGVMKGLIEETFEHVLTCLIEIGLVKLENYFLDGSKLEADANKYSFVWKKSMKKHKEKLKVNIKNLLKQIEEENEKENEIYGDEDLEEVGENIEIDSEKLAQKVKELEDKIRKINEERDIKKDSKEKDKELKKAVKTIRKDYLPRLKKYEEQEKILGQRNSYSKTDTDAVFMRMKEDHMKNGQLKPGYNIQLGTENQYIINYTTHQRPGDSPCLIPHMEKLKDRLGKLPENLIADAGYGSEENYDYLEKNGIESYVKYQNFHLEQKRNFKDKIFRVENFPYDREKDEYICPGQRRMKFIKEIEYKTDNGYNTKRHIYECVSCKGCELKHLCTKAKGNRQIRIGIKLNEFKAKAKKKLCSEKGLELRSKRPVDVESVFGRLKHNWSFRRFFLRGIEKVTTELGILSVAHNIAKLATALA